MNCEKAKELLWGYCAEELTAIEEAELEQHLEGCAECRQELELCREMQEMMKNLPEEELPEGYHTELMQKLEKEAKAAETVKTEWAVIPFRERVAEHKKKQKDKQMLQKKKQRMHRQWGMIAAAAVLVAATGPIQDMWEQQKQHRHDVIYESPYQEESVKIENMTDPAVMPIAEEAVEKQKEITAESAAEQSRMTADPMTETIQEDAAQSEQEKKEASAGGTVEPMSIQTAEENTIAAEPMTGADMQEVPQTAAYTPEEATPMMAREMPAQEVAEEAAVKESSEVVSLKVMDEEAVKETIRGQIALLNGQEEATETGMTVLLPSEQVATFYEALGTLGELSWIQNDGTVVDAAYCRIAIQFVTE